mmetsp:Transcript_38092/g.73040  ORF Transcript_38092/g.73040 Transcript_38092/m.73040 type:complete len:298 (-) Transcript_38092:391-1284(-)
MESLCRSGLSVRATICPTQVLIHRLRRTRDPPAQGLAPGAQRPPRNEARLEPSQRRAPRSRNTRRSSRTSGVTSKAAAEWPMRIWEYACCTERFAAWTSAATWGVRNRCRAKCGTARRTGPTPPATECARSRGAPSTPRTAPATASRTGEGTDASSPAAQNPRGTPPSSARTTAGASGASTKDAPEWASGRCVCASPTADARGASERGAPSARTKTVFASGTAEASGVTLMGAPPPPGAGRDPSTAPRTEGASGARTRSAARRRADPAGTALSTAGASLASNREDARREQWGRQGSV